MSSVNNIIKTKKCQPDAGDRPDLIQTEPVPSTGLARNKNKNQLNEKLKNDKTNYLSSVNNNIKTKKCQPDAGDRPDLIQTEPVPSTGLARNKNKNQPNEKLKKYKTNYLSHVTPHDLADSLPVANLLSASRVILSQECTSPVYSPVANERTEDSVQHPDGKWLTDVVTKTTKVSACCQAHTVSWPHPCGVGAGVPDDGLARPQNKNKQNEKKKKYKSNYSSHVTLVEEDNHMKQSQVTNKTTKVSACCQAHTVSWPHPRGVGVGVPDDGLARPKSNYLSDVTLSDEDTLLKPTQVSNKTTKVSACCQAHTVSWPHPCGVGAGVPDDGLARPKSNYSSNVTMVRQDKHTKWVRRISATCAPPKMRLLSQLLPSYYTILIILLLSQQCMKKLPPRILREFTTDNNCCSSEYRFDGLNTWIDLQHSTRSDRLNSKMLSELLENSWKVAEYNLSHKNNNKQVKIINGNRVNLKQLKVMHWNCGSRAWINKMVEIEGLLAEKKPDLIFITEANLWDDVNLDECQITGHKLYFPKTMDSMNHARILLVVRNDLNIHILEEHMDAQTASIWLRVGNSKKNSIVIGGLYREHIQLGRGETHLSWQEKQTRQIWRWNRIVNNWKQAGRNKKCFVLGDLNLDYLKWGAPDSSQENMIEKVQDDIETEGFVQIIRNHTRQQEGQTDSLIDHCWTNSRDRVIRHSNTSRGDSDHNVISVDISCKDLKLGGQNIRKRSWKNYDKTRCLNNLKNIDWSDILETTNVDLANSMLEERLKSVIEKEAPMSIVQVRTKYNCYITDSTKVTMASRDVARDRARLTGDPDDWSTFRSLRNSCTRLQRQDKSKHLKATYDSIEKEKDTAKLYRTTKNLLGSQGAGPPTNFLINGRHVTKQKEIANTQADHYVNKVKYIKETLPRVCQDPLKLLDRAFSRWKPISGKPRFQLKSATLSEVIKIINGLKNSHAYGHDDIDAFTIKMAAPVIGKVITHVINLSLGTATVPQKWKIARVLPLLKSSTVDTKSPGSYRPIAQLTVISKLTERIIQSQILSYLEITGQIASSHHAYRKKCSTTTGLIQVMDTIAQGIDDNEVIATLTVDQSAAFDCVEHKILIEKLQYYGITDDTLAWIVSYLSHRSFYVSIGSSVSDYKSLNFGVPQGSVLGPLLYLVYVNDFPSLTENIDCKNPTHLDDQILFGGPCKLCGTLPVFADDGQFLKSCKNRNSNQDSIEEMFVRIRDFLNALGLEVNEAKTVLTEYMVGQKRVKLRGVPPELTVLEKKLIDGRTEFRDKHITDTISSRFLGLNLQNNLLWDAHLRTGKKAILPACRRLLGMLTKLRNCLSRKIDSNSPILSFSARSRTVSVYGVTPHPVPGIGHRYYSIKLVDSYQGYHYIPEQEIL